MGMRHIYIDFVDNRKTNLEWWRRKFFADF